MGISLFLILIRYLGLLLPFETFLYDCLFYLKDSEPVDKRIVIVGWNEDDVREYSEGFISDNNLVKVLKTIKKQQPSVIGLDIFRDVPVPSFYLSKQENQQAHRELNKIFSSTQNLVGITKVIPPFIDYPQSLADENRITSADLPVDEDNFIRRAYLFPQPEEKSELFNILSLSFYTTLQYLTDKGFSLKNAEKNSSTMLFYNEENNSQLLLNPWERFDGSYITGDAGIQFIVNWRKNKAPFLQVSVTEVIEGSIPPDIFENKIVLIGNTSVSTADRHHTPLNRFSRSNLDAYTKGVAVHAHITSSIISAVLDGRPLIKTIPEWSEILLLLLSVGSIVLVAAKYSQDSLKLLFISSAAGLIITIVLLSISYIGFTEGYWIPVLPSVIGSIVSPSTVCLVAYIREIKQNNQEIKQVNRKLKQTNREIEQKNRDFKQLVKDSNHLTRNYLNSILGNAKMAFSIFEEIEGADIDESVEAIYDYENRRNKSPLPLIKNNIKRIIVFTSRLNNQEKTLQEYLRISSIERNLFATKPLILNEFLKTVVADLAIVKKYQYSFSIQIQEIYDSNLNKVLIEPRSLSGAIENLVDNAFYGINQKLKNNPSHEGIVIVKTKKQQNNAIITVSDNGIGINSSMLDQIFKLKFTTKARNEGQGLGLSLVKETIQRHKGQINVESTVGEGTVFTISLPLKKQ